MADLLEKVQVLQLAVLKLNDGHSLHVDHSSHQNYTGEDFHPSLSVALFDGHCIEQTWDFYSHEDKEELEHILEDLAYHISRL